MGLYEMEIGIVPVFLKHMWQDKCIYRTTDMSCAPLTSESVIQSWELRNDNADLVPEQKRFCWATAGFSFVS